MKMRRKIISLLIVLFLVFVLYSNFAVFATTTAKLNAVYTPQSKEFLGIGEELFGIIKSIAVISSVVLLAFCGLKIMFGSVDEKAEYKKSLMPIVIGSLVVLFATTIVSLVQQLA